MRLSMRDDESERRCEVGCPSFCTDATKVSTSGLEDFAHRNSLTDDAGSGFSALFHIEQAARGCANGIPVNRPMFSDKIAFITACGMAPEAPPAGV